MKKILALAGAGAMVLAVAVPVLAHGRGRSAGNSNVAIVNNGATSVASTGWNTQGNGVSVNGGDEVEDVTVGGDNSLTTGSATSYAGALVVANTRVGCTTCSSSRRGDNNFAMVTNVAGSGAYTDLNGQGNGVTVNAGDEVEDVTVRGDNTLVTGPANSTSRAWVVVNTNWAR